MGKKKESSTLKEQLDTITKKLNSDWLDEDTLTKEIILDEDILWIHKPCIEIAGDPIGGILLSYFINEYESRYTPNKLLFWMRIDTSFLQTKFCLTPKQIENAIENLRNKELIITTIIYAEQTKSNLYIIADINYLKELMIDTTSAKNYFKSKQPKVNHKNNYQCYIMSHSYMMGPPLEDWLFLPFEPSWLKYFSKKEQIDMRLYYMVIGDIDNVSKEDMERASLLEALVITDRIEFSDYWIVLDETSDIFQWHKESMDNNPIDNPFETLEAKKFIQIKENYNDDSSLNLLYIKINREQIGEQLELISQLPKQRKVMQKLKELFNLITKPESINNDYQIN